MCLSLVVAGCVLWTSQQDGELACLLETELGLVAVKTRDTKENGREPLFLLLWKQVLIAFWGKCASCLGNRPSYSLHYLLLGMK